MRMGRGLWGGSRKGLVMSDRAFDLIAEIDRRIADGRGAIDTDGILDRCSECGSFVRVIVDSAGRHGAECIGCGNAVCGCESKSAAMVDWNRQQRSAISRRLHT